MLGRLMMISHFTHLRFQPARQTWGAGLLSKHGGFLLVLPVIEPRHVRKVCSLPSRVPLLAVIYSMLLRSRMRALANDRMKLVSLRDRNVLVQAWGLDGLMQQDLCKIAEASASGATLEEVESRLTHALDIVFGYTTEEF
jgi:hypothetical protein